MGTVTSDMFFSLAAWPLTGRRGRFKGDSLGFTDTAERSRFPSDLRRSLRRGLFVAASLSSPFQADVFRRKRGTRGLPLEKCMLPVFIGCVISTGSGWPSSLPMLRDVFGRQVSVAQNYTVSEKRIFLSGK
jgi:hypothetical protein